MAKGKFTVKGVSGHKKSRKRSKKASANKAAKKLHK